MLSTIQTMHICSSREKKRRKGNLKHFVYYKYSGESQIKECLPGLQLQSIYAIQKESYIRKIKQSNHKINAIHISISILFLLLLFSYILTTAWHNEPQLRRY